MRKFLALVCLLPSLAFAQFTVPQHTGATASGGGGTRSVIQHANTNFVCSGTTCSLQFPSNVTAGSAYVIGLVYDNGVSLSSIASNNSEICAATSTELNNGIGSGAKFDLYYCKNASTTPNARPTITATFATAASFADLTIAEVGNVSSTSPFDVGTGALTANTGAAGTPYSSGNTSATSFAAEIVIGYSGVDSGPISAGSGFTLFDTDTVAGMESKNVSATGAQAATFTSGTASDNASAMVATFH